MKRVPMGTHWIESPKPPAIRRWDGVYATTGRRLRQQVESLARLWCDPDKARAWIVLAEAGCQKFLAFMRDIICSGNEVDFGYLLRREATIFQKRKRTEIAIGCEDKRKRAAVRAFTRRL